jgi:hypothetical protein
MPSDSHRSRLIPPIPGAKCKQCNVEAADRARTDGLGRSCGEIKDKAQKVAREHAERQKA